MIGSDTYHPWVFQNRYLNRTVSRRAPLILTYFKFIS